MKLWIKNIRLMFPQILKKEPAALGIWLAADLLDCFVPLIQSLIPSLIIALITMNLKPEWTAAVIVFSFLGLGLLGMLRERAAGRVTEAYLQVRLNVFNLRLYEKILNTDYANVEPDEKQKQMGQALMSMKTNWEGIEGFLRHFNTTLTAVLSLVLALTMMSALNWQIAALLIGLTLLSGAAQLWARQYESRSLKTASQLWRKRHYIQREGLDLSNGKDIRLYQMQRWLGDKLMTLAHARQRIFDQLGLRCTAAFSFDEALNFIRDLAVYSYLIAEISRGMPVASFTMALAMTAVFSQRLKEVLLSGTQMLQDCHVNAPYWQYLALPETGKGKVMLEMTESLEIIVEHVSFAYPGSSRLILDDLSFTWKPHQKIALVGVNGAGKTTLVKLLCGLMQPTEGQILINGVPLSSMDIPAWQKQVGVVFQESLIFPYSLKDNITLSEACADEAALWRSLEQSGLNALAKSLPQGLDTELTRDLHEEGRELSGGQKQKLMLARALYHNRPLLISDEPTAALDPLAENELYQRYNELIAGHSALYISHRLSSTQFCDRILVLENGKIAEQGTHQELMEHGGSYARMFDIQSQYYKEGNFDENQRTVF